MRLLQRRRPHLTVMKEYMVIGTWAETYNGESGGELRVYRYEAGKAALLQAVDVGKSVSMFTCDRERGLLFAACETNYHDKNMPGGELRVYQTGKEGTLTLSGTYNSYGGFPVGIAQTKKYIVVLNHGSSLAKVCLTYRNEDGKFVTEFVSDEANLCLFARTQDGSVGTLLDRYVFRGRGTLPVFQESPAPHDLYYVPEKKLFYVPMRGTDETRVFSIQEEAKKLEPAGILENRSQTGPRNAVCTVGKEGVGYVYVVGEIEPLVTVFREDDDGWTKIQELRTVEKLPEKVPVTSFEYPHPSGILLHEEKKKLYTITRKANVLTIFTMASDGTLIREREFTLGGENPRQMVLAKDVLFVVCMDSRNILEMKLDEDGNPVQVHPIIQQADRIAYMKLI